jgi:hypothetical protein
MEDGKFTLYAGKAVALAEVFKYTLGKETFVGPSVCRLELSAPAEESTDGGRLAVQHVSIVPESGGSITVMATAYQVERRAEARQYEVVAETYKKRFRTGTFPVSPGQFDEMTRRLKEFFEQFYFKFEIAALPPPGTGAPPASTRRPTAGPLAPAQVASRPTASGRSAAHTASRQVVAEGTAARPHGSRVWLVAAAAALVAAAVSGAAVYFLR